MESEPLEISYPLGYKVIYQFPLTSTTNQGNFYFNFSKNDYVEHPNFLE